MEQDFIDKYSKPKQDLTSTTNPETEKGVDTEQAFIDAMNQPAQLTQSAQSAQSPQPAQSTQQIVSQQTGGIPEEAFDYLGEALRHAGVLPRSEVGPKIENWFKKYYPQVQIPEGFVDTISTSVEIVDNQVKLREQMGYSVEESGFTKATKAIGKGYRSGAGFGISGYVKGSYPVEKDYEKEQDNLSNAINSFIDTSPGNKIANSALIKGVFKQLGLAAEFHAFPNKDRFTTGSVQAEAQKRYESPVARQITNELQDALQTTFIRSDVAERVLQTGRDLSTPINLVFEGLENQGYTVIRERNALRIRTPENKEGIEDGVSGRWATIPFTALSPGFWGFDNGEQVVKQIFATVGLEVGTEASVRGAAKKVIGSTVPGKVYKGVEAARRITRIVKLNNRLKKAGLDQQEALVALFKSAALSTTKTARVGRFVGRTAGRGMLAAGANEVYLGATEKSRARHAVEMLDLTNNEALLHNLGVLSATDEADQAQVITALYKSAINNERLPTAIAGAAGSAIFDVVGGLLKGALSYTEAFNTKVLLDIHDKLGQFKPVLDEGGRIKEIDLSGVKPDGMRILESLGGVQRKDPTSEGFAIYKNPNNWEATPRIESAGYSIEDLTELVKTKKVDQLAALKSIRESEISSKVPPYRIDSVEMHYDDYQNAFTTQAMSNIELADNKLASHMGGDVNTSIAHILDVLTRGSGDIKADSLAKFTDLSVFRRLQLQSNQTLKDVIRKKELLNISDSDIVSIMRGLSSEGGRPLHDTFIGDLLTSDSADVADVTSKIVKRLRETPLRADVNQAIDALKGLEGTSLPQHITNIRLRNAIEQYYTKSILSAYAKDAERAGLTMLEVQDIPEQYFRIPFRSREARVIQQAMSNIRQLSTLTGTTSEAEAKLWLKQIWSKVKFSPLAATSGGIGNILKAQSFLIAMRLANLAISTIRVNPQLYRDISLSNNLKVLLLNSPRSVQFNNTLARLGNYIGMDQETKNAFIQVAETFRASADNPTTVDPDIEKIPGFAEFKSIEEADFIYTNVGSFRRLSFNFREDGKYTKNELQELRNFINDTPEGVSLKFVEDRSGALRFVSSTAKQDQLDDMKTLGVKKSAYNWMEVMLDE